MRPSSPIVATSASPAGGQARLSASGRRPQLLLHERGEAAHRRGVVARASIRTRASRSPRRRASSGAKAASHPHMGENVSAMEPLEFLRAHPPWSRLDAEAQRAVEEALEIAYAPRGTRVLRQGGPPAAFLYVVRKGQLRLERDGRLLQVLEEGEAFGFPSLIGRASPHADVVAAEDSLLYQVPAGVFARLMRRARSRRRSSWSWARACAAPPRSSRCRSPPSSARRSVPADRPGGRGGRGDDGRRRGPPDARRGHERRRGARRAARLLTDSDLRGRVLAEGRGPETPAGAVASRPVRTIGAEATLAEALVFMLEHHVHHAPVESDGHVVGMLTDADLLRLQAEEPALPAARDRAASSRGRARPLRDGPRGHGRVALGGRARQATRLGPIVSRLERRARGAAPAPRRARARPAALRVRVDRARVGGAARADARHRPGQRTRVRGGLGGGARLLPRLAAHVVQGLVAASFPPCAGGFMATGWTHPLAEWERIFRRFVETPEPAPLMQALNFLDFRVVDGRLALEPLDAVVRGAAASRASSPTSRGPRSASSRRSAPSARCAARRAGST